MPRDGVAVTFMAKYDEREGNSCHIHLSVRALDVFADEPPSTASSPASSPACGT